MTNRSIVNIVKSAPVVMPGDTVRRCSSLIRATDGSSLIVMVPGRIIGTVSESTIASFLAVADDQEQALDTRIESLVDENVVFLNIDTTLRQAAQVFSQTGTDVLPVIDSTGAYKGVVYRSDVVAMLTKNLRPPQVAGMATPLGVYLTTGTHSGGAGSLGLFLTGVSLALMLIVSNLAVFGLMWVFELISGIPVTTYLASPPIIGSFRFTAYDIVHMIAPAIAIITFFIIMRLSPLSGYHAAEHMTVHAMEAGEAITTDSVRRMPRVHPRCGTNLLAGAGVFVLIVTYFNSEIAVLIALLVVVLGWRQVGGWLQAMVTTKTPTESQLANGVAAGNELLEKYQDNPNLVLTGFDRIWKLGFLQTAAGLILIYWLFIEVLLELLPIPVLL